jgi:hypothetical protein
MTYPGADPALEPDRAAVEARRKEREEEFSVWVAAQDIPWGSVVANYRGEAVAKGTVEARGWDQMGLVVKRDSEQGRQILEELSLATDEDRERWAAASPTPNPTTAPVKATEATKSGDK